MLDKPHERIGRAQLGHLTQQVLIVPRCGVLSLPRAPQSGLERSHVVVGSGARYGQETDRRVACPFIGKVMAFGFAQSLWPFIAMELRGKGNGARVPHARQESRATSISNL